MHPLAPPMRLQRTPHSSEELVRHCQQTLPQDSTCFEMLVARYKGLVFKTAFRLMGNQADADDQAQEVFLKIYRRIKELDDPQALTTWIYRITVNTCLDALRKEKRNPIELFEIPSDNPEDEANKTEIKDTRSPTPEEAAVRNEALECIEETWAKMEPTNRAILMLREIEERPYEEIAKILDMGLSAIKMRIHRARLLFKQLLDQICPDLYDDLSNKIDQKPSL